MSSILSADQLLHGRLTSTTTGSGTTAPSKRAPEEVLLAVLGAHSSLPKTAITRKRNPDTNSSALLLNMLLLGSTPNPGSYWRAGSVGHDDGHPERYNVCRIHHRYLLDQARAGAAHAKPCPDGPSCRRCHEAHPEQLGRMRGP